MTRLLDIGWTRHVPLVGGVLLAVSALVGLDAYFFIDEAALIAQVEIKAEDGGWTAPLPFPEQEPTPVTPPMARSTVVDGTFAPFPNHPLHVELATGARRLLGTHGPRALSIAGTLGAATAVGALCRRHGNRRAVAGLWTTAVATPLLFDNQLVTGHTVGAAAAGVLALAVTVRDIRPWSIPTAALASAAGVLLRSEFLLLVAALALVVGVRALRDRSGPRFALAASAAFGAALAYLVEPLWTAAVTGTTDDPFTITADARGDLATMVRTAARTLIDPGGGRTDLAGSALVIVVVAVVAAVVVSTRRPHEVRFGVVVVGFASVAAAVRLTDPALTPGLLMAFPLLTVAMVAWPRHPPDAHASQLALAAALFGALVLATQYADGGGVEWGWRYFAVAIPLVVPAVVAVGSGFLTTEPAAWRSTHVAALVLVALLVTGSGLRFQADAITETDRFVRAAVESASDVDLVVSLDASYGRFAWPVSIEGRLTTTDEQSVARVAKWLEQRGAQRILVVWNPFSPPDDRALRPFRPADDLGTIGGTSYQGAVYVRP